MENTSHVITRPVVQGEFEMSDDPRICLSAILGSCVSICIFDPKAGVGGMNHFLRPGSVDDEIGDKKYGIHAVDLLISGLLHLGGNRTHLRAKVFGGANMNVALGHVGRQNSDFALSYLDIEGIPVVSVSVGGAQARRVRFWPYTGMAQQRLVQDSEVRPTERMLIKPDPARSEELF